MTRVLILNDCTRWHAGSAAVIDELKHWFKDAIVETAAAPIEVSHPLPKADFVVLNGEGTLHDNAPAAVAWLRLLGEFQSQGVPTAVVNATVWRMKTQHLQPLRRARVVGVRDRQSSEVLDRFDIPHHIHPDLSLGFLARHISPGVEREYPSCPPYWIVGRSWRTPPQKVAERYKSLVDFPAEFMEVPRSHDPRAFAGFAHDLRMRDDTVFLTGEFHAFCAAAYTGVPVVVITGNTPKIEGMVAYLNTPVVYTGTSAVEDARRFAPRLAEELQRRMGQQEGIRMTVRRWCPCPHRPEED